MNEKNYKKRLDFQQKMIARQSTEIENLKSQIEKLKLELQEKDKIIDSVTPLRNELKQHIAEIEKKKGKYDELEKELRKMKDVMNQAVFKNRWSLIKLLMK